MEMSCSNQHEQGVGLVTNHDGIVIRNLIVSVYKRRNYWGGNRKSCC